MKVNGLDGRLYAWRLDGRSPRADDTRARSSYHLRARQLLAELFPFDRRLEEVPLPGSGKLSADFVVVGRQLVVEVHGEQHYEYVQHFHGDPAGFARSLARDSRKREWCDLNRFAYVELPHDESDEQWRDRIFSAIAPTAND